MAHHVENQTQVKFFGYAATEPGSDLQGIDYEPKPLGEWEVEVAITHCGICHSDVHLIDNDWNMSKFPFIPGHEIIGTVSSKGSAVNHLNLGDRVGIGWQCGSCSTCKECLSGRENICKQGQPTCVGRNGGFATGIRADGRFAFKIPDDLSSVNAAPLLCGGATVYSPLRVYGVKPKDKVAVIGVGGLGHLALQFLNAMGCEVTAISHSSDKEVEALSLGAHHFINSSDPTQMKSVEGAFDFMMTTSYVDLDWVAYLNLLQPDGTLCYLGVPPGPINITPAMLVTGQRRLVGGAIGSRFMITEMLEFSARHQIEAMTEEFPLADVNIAVEKLRKGDVRYRAVLNCQS